MLLVFSTNRVKFITRTSKMILKKGQREYLFNAALFSFFEFCAVRILHSLYSGLS